METTEFKRDPWNHYIRKNGSAAESNRINAVLFDPLGSIHEMTTTWPRWLILALAGGSLDRIEHHDPTGLWFLNRSLRLTPRGSILFVYTGEHWEVSSRIQVMPLETFKEAWRPASGD